MIRNYLKIALKVLARRKFFTFISLFGICITLVVLMVATAMLDQIFAPAGAGDPWRPHARHLSDRPAQQEHRLHRVRRLRPAGPRAAQSHDRGAGRRADLDLQRPGDRHLLSRRPAGRVLAEAHGRRVLAHPRLRVPGGAAVQPGRRAERQSRRGDQRVDPREVLRRPAGGGQADRDRRPALPGRGRGARTCRSCASSPSRTSGCR